MASEGKSRRQSPVPAAKAPPRRRARGGGLADLFSMDSERSARLLIIGSVVLVLIVVAGFLGFGYYYSVVRPRNRTVLEAEGVKISYSAMKRRMAYELVNGTRYQSQAGFQALPEGTAQTLLTEIILVTRAESELGVTVDDQQFRDQIRTHVGVGKDGDERAYADALRRQLDTTGLHQDEYERIVKAELVTSNIKDKFKTELPAQAPQAKLDVMSFNDEDSANKAIARVKAGDDWSKVAKDVSKEVDVQSTGGAHNYAPQGTFNPAYDDYAFSAAVGDISPPLQSSGGQFFVVRVVDRADKPVTDDQKPALANKKYDDWLQDQQGQITVKRDFDAQSQLDALNSVVGVAGARLQKQRQQQQAPALQATVVVPPPSQQQQQAPAQQPPANPADEGGGNNPQVPGGPVVPGGGNGQ